jgi:hypothetical protein
MVKDIQSINRSHIEYLFLSASCNRPMPNHILAHYYSISKVRRYEDEGCSFHHTSHKSVYGGTTRKCSAANPIADSTEGSGAVLNG